MWSATERDALQMELRVEYRSRRRTVPSGVLPAPDFKACAEDFSNIEDRFLKQYQAGKAVVYVADKALNNVGRNTFLTILIAISDKRRPDHVLTNPIAEQRRQIEKNDGEGNEHSCHVVINLTPTMEGGHCYKAAFEQVPLFSSQYVNRFIRHVFKQVTMTRPRTVPNPAGVRENGEFEPVPVALKTEFRAVPSEELLNDLKNGVISQIELSREEAGLQKFDEGAYTVDKRSTLLLEPAKNRQMPPISDVIASVCKTASKKEFTTARVRWRAGGQSHTAKFDCDTASIADNRYIKRHTFVLEAPLPASCDKIDAHLARLMMAWIS